VSKIKQDEKKPKQPDLQHHQFVDFLWAPAFGGEKDEVREMERGGGR
jgi:hypothetical protein